MPGKREASTDMRKDLQQRARYVPLVASLRTYSRSAFVADFIAGLTVGVVSIPQAVAYALLAGLPPQAGLYACILPVVLYGVFGSSKQIVVGPVAIAALMVAAVIAEHSPRFEVSHLQIAGVLCLQTTLILWLLRSLGLGGVTTLLSRPVIQGFVNAAAVLIIVSQLPSLSGIDVDASTKLTVVARDLWAHRDSFSAIAFLGGTVAIAVLWGIPRVGRWTEIFDADSVMFKLGPLLVAGFGIAFVGWFGVDLAVTGSFPSGLPSFSLVSFDLDLWLDLLPSACLISIVAYVESYTVGETLAGRQRSRVDPNQELFALGAANFGAAVTGAYPVSGSFSRSSVNYIAGAVSQVSNLWSVVVIVVALLWATSLLSLLPLTVLAAIVIVAAIEIFNFGSLRAQWKFCYQDVIAHVATFFTVLIFGVTAGLATGVGLAILLFVQRSSQARVALLGRIEGSPHFRNVENFDVEMSESAAALRVDESIYFANANRIEDRVLAAVEANEKIDQVVLVCSAINFIDATGLDMLRRLNANLQMAGITLNLSEVKTAVKAQLDVVAFDSELSGSVFFSTDEAITVISASDIQA